MSNVIVMNNSYVDENALRDVFNYCARKASYGGGYGIRLESESSAINSMMYIKQYHGKTDGKQVCHIVVGVDTICDTGREYTKKQSAIDGEVLDRFAGSLSEYIYRKHGYQNCYFRHVSQSYRPHVHYVINPVHVRTGKKLASHSDLAKDMYNLVLQYFPDLRWKGVRYNKGDYDEWED